MDNAFDNIEKYLNGELEERAARQFEADLAESPDLRLATERHREMIARLRGSALRQKVSENIASASKAADQPMTYSVSRRQALALAASLLLVAAAVYFVSRPGKTAQPEIAQTPKTETPTTLPNTTETPTGEIAQTPSPRPQAPNRTPKPQAPAPKTKPNKYQLAYARAVAELRPVELRPMSAARPDTSIENLFKVVDNLLQQNNPDGAAAHLGNILEKKNPLYMEEAEWRKVVCLLAKEPKTAQESLQKIARDPEHGFQKAARKLLAELKQPEEEEENPDDF